MENVRQKLKLFNYRPLVLIFLGLMGGILFYVFLSKVTWLVITASIVALACIIFYSILHKKIKYLVIMIICFLLGVALGAIAIDRVDRHPEDPMNKTIVATVYNIKNKGSYLALLLKDVEIDGDEVDYNIQLNYFNTFDTGYIKITDGLRIKFKPTEKLEINYYSDSGEPNYYYFKNNISLRLKAEEIDVVRQTNSVRLSLLSRVKSNLKLGLSNQNCEMIYSAMFGDKTYLGEDLYDAYRTAGLAHLLAVSGLHIGLVVAVIYWIVNKLRIKKWLRVAIIATFLFGYVYMCNFSYSAIRASIMALVLCVAPIVFSEYDILNSICFAGCIILLIDPLALFDVSSLLSFGCVFGIAMLYPIIKKLFAKTKAPRWIADSVSISLSTMISIFAVMAYFFNEMQLIGILSNVIILPIFSVLFSLIFILSILSLMLPVISYSLILVNPLFEWMNWIIIFISNLTTSMPIIKFNYLSILLWFTFIVFAGRYNLKRGLIKAVMSTSILAIISVQLLAIA